MGRLSASVIYFIFGLLVGILIGAPFVFGLIEGAAAYNDGYIDGSLNSLAYFQCIYNGYSDTVCDRYADQVVVYCREGTQDDCAQFVTQRLESLG